jgi:hypothetical protein
MIAVGRYTFGQRQQIELQKIDCGFTDQHSVGAQQRQD